MISTLEEIHIHRITKWLRLEAISQGHLSNILLRQGHLELVAQDQVQADFECQMEILSQ